MLRDKGISYLVACPDPYSNNLKLGSKQPNDYQLLDERYNLFLQKVAV